MDTEFDGFMKTLNHLNDDAQFEPTSSFDVDIEDLLRSDGSSHFKNQNATQISVNSISTTVKIENEVNDMHNVIKSSDSKPTSTTGEYASMHNQFMQSIKEIKDLNLSHDSAHKPSELRAKSSIDSRVDAELKHLLETGLCEQQEPEQSDTVELSISDDDDQSESEIILQHIDDLESVKSAIDSIAASPPTNKMDHKESAADSDSNQPEYDLISFGITETTSPENIKDTNAPLLSVRASLPSTSSFDNHPTSQSIAIVSNKSSVAATPLKQKTSSDTKRKRHDSIQSTPFKTPITNKQNAIQTPRHSLKHSVKSKHKLQDRQMEEEIARLKEALQAEQHRTKQLSIQIQSLQNQLTLSRNNNNSAQTDAPKLSIEDAERMNKEIQSMDRIIAGLNEENAKLIQQLKDQKCNPPPTQREQIKHNALSEEFKVQPAVLSEMQRLRKELQETKDTATCREKELGIEINKLKEDNRSRQFKLDGMDKQSFDHESHVIAEFKKEAFKIQKKSQKQINELKRKLKWYIENQELIENLNQQIKHKNETIQSLKSSQASSPNQKQQTCRSTKKVKPNANEHRTIVILKKKVHDLEKLLSSKHPDSIANLMLVMNSNPNDNDEHQNMIITQLREEITNLQEALDGNEDETLSRLRGLRQQNDKIQLALKEKIKHLQQQWTQCKREKGFIRPSVKVKELNQQIVDLKQRLKIVKDKKYKSSSEIQVLNTQLSEKETTVQHLQMMLETEKRLHNGLKTQIGSLQNQLKNTQFAGNQFETIDIDAGGTPTQFNQTDENKQLIYERNSLQKQLNMLRKTHEATKITVHQLERENTDEKEHMYKEKIRIMESEINEYKRQSAVLTEKVELERGKGEQAVKAMQTRLEWTKLEMEKTQQLIVKLQFELNHAKNTPSYVEYETLLRKLEKIEKRGSDRERELEETYTRLLMSNGDVEEQLTTKYENMITNKDQQIRSLQSELSVLMTAFDKIQTNS
eukprot:556095_1